MGKMLILLLAGAGIIFGIIGLNVFKSGSDNVLNSVAEVTKVYAKNNSTSGVEIAFRALSEDSTWTGVQNKSLKNGSVSISVITTSSKYYNGPNAFLPKGREITSIGTYNGYSDTVRAVMQLPRGITSSVPRFLRYSIASDNNVNLGGNINIKDDNNPLWNASIHTNSNFTMNGNNVIEGFLTFQGTASSDPAGRLVTNIIPNTNPDNLPNYFQDLSGVPIPVFNPDDYISIATMIYNSSITISGNTTLGTKSSPAIIYVNGNLTISGNFTGYGAFIVKGTVTTGGNFTLTTVNPIGCNLGIYATGNVNLQGGIIRAQILTNSDVIIGSNTQLYGGITAKGIISFQGGADFFYRPSSPELTDPFWNRDPAMGHAPKIVSYYSN